MTYRATASLLASVVLVGAALAAPAHAESRGVVRNTVLAHRAATFTPLAVTRIANSNGAYQGDVAIASGGQRAFEVGEDALRVLDITKNPARVVGRTTGVFGRDIAVRPGRNYAYVTNDRALYVVNIARDQPRKTHSYNNTFGGDVLDMAISPGGRYLAVGFGGYLDPKEAVRIYSLANPAVPRPIRQIDLTNTPSMLAWNRQGTRLALGLGLTGELQFINTANPAKAARIGRPIAMPQQNSPTAAVFSQDGSSIWVVGDDDSIITRVNVAARSVARSWSYPSTSNDGGVSIVQSPDTLYLYVLFEGSDDDPTVFVLNRATMKPVFRGNGITYPTGMAVSPAGPTKGSVYFVTEPYLDPGYFLGLRRS